MFYNGTAKAEDRFEYKLSDMYEKCEEKPDLELNVTVLNMFEAGMEEGIAKGIEEERLNSIRNMIDIKKTDFCE